MKDEAEHTCQFCYYEYFDSRAYPCSMCVCGEERTDKFQPKGRRNKRNVIRNSKGDKPLDYLAERKNKCRKCRNWTYDGVGYMCKNLQVGLPCEFKRKEDE